MMNALFTLLLLVPQDAKTATRQEKTEYNAAVAKCREAEAMLESDPQGAVERLSEITGNARLRLIECMIKIEQRPAEERCEPPPEPPGGRRGEPLLRSLQDRLGHPTTRRPTEQALAAVQMYLSAPR